MIGDNNGAVYSTSASEKLQSRSSLPGYHHPYWNYLYTIATG